MEVSCPQCKTLFAVELNQLRAHRGRVQCGRCEWVFSLPSIPQIGGLPRPLTSKISGQRGLQLAAVALAAFLILQMLWWGRAYVATLPGVYSLLAVAEHLGLSVPWPQDLRYIRVEQADWGADHVMHGKLRNDADYVQALPRLRLIVTGNHGELLDQVLLGPADYLPDGVRRGQGLLPGQTLSFRIPAPGPVLGTGFQVLPEPH